MTWWLVGLLVGAYTTIGIICFYDMESELYRRTYTIDFAIVASVFWIIYQPISAIVYFYKRYKMIKAKENKYKNK